MPELEINYLLFTVYCLIAIQAWSSSQSGWWTQEMLACEWGIPIAILPMGHSLDSEKMCVKFVC